MGQLSHINKVRLNIIRTWTLCSEQPYIVIVYSYRWKIPSVTRSIHFSISFDRKLNIHVAETIHAVIFTTICYEIMLYLFYRVCVSRISTKISFHKREENVYGGLCNRAVLTIPFYIYNL